VLTGTLTGVKDGDAVTESFSTDADEKSGVREHKIAARADGEDAVLANYDVERIDGTLKITKAPLSVKANDASRNYGDANPGFTGVITGVKNNDAISATYSSPTTPASKVGSYAIVPEVVATAAVLANYETPALDNGTLTVDKAPLSVKADDKTKVYGDGNPVLTGTLTGVKNGDAVTASFSTDADEKSGVGEHKIAARADGEDAVLANYEVKLVDGTLTITKAPLSVKANDATRKYGEANIGFTSVITGIKNGDAVKAEYSSAATPASKVGTYPIVPKVVATEEVLANYEAPVLTNGTLEVTKAPLSVKADNKTKVYGEDNPVLTGELIGVKNQDLVTASFSTDADEKTGVGQYKIAADVKGEAGVLANYEVDRVDGTLTITKAPLSVKANDATRLLGAENPVFTGTITGVENGDAVTASYSTPATTASPVGTYPIVPQVVGTAAVLANYQDPVLTNSTLTITYRWDGFLQPINDTAHQTGVESKFKLGQTVPAKFVIKNASGAVVTQATNPTFARSVNLGQCDANAVAENVTDDLTPAAGGTYGWDGSKYHYNWSTKGLTAGEYRIYANLADGTKRFVDICLTK
jgi:MBG domain (YGX type)